MKTKKKDFFQFSKWLKYVQRFLYLINKTSFRGFSISPAENVVWMKIWGIKFFKEDHFSQYMGLIDALSRRGEKFNIKFSYKLGDLRNRRVFLRYSRHLCPFGFVNYSETLHFFCRQMEIQKCRVYPPLGDVLYWENKGYMTRRFLDLGISIPKTRLATSLKDIEEAQFSYPFLIKEEHSAASEGVYKINTRAELERYLTESRYFDFNQYLVVQELLNIRRDLRVTFIGDRIVLHYWRINKSAEWKPTSTSHGSEVDFGNFPEKWRSFITDQYRKLGLSTGAFDIAWQNDDLETTPLILEVSPNYQPNPLVDISTLGMSYGQFKEKFLFFNSYDHKFVDLTFSIMKEQVDNFLNKSEIVLT